VKIAGITPHPDSRSMTQIARNLTDPNDGFLRGKRYLILDRDTKYSDAFRSVLVREGIQVIRLPPRSPNLNAFAERFVHRFSTRSGSSWRTIIPSAIIRAWKTDFRSPHPSLSYPITLFNADSASAECSATTIGPQPDECRFFFWTSGMPGLRSISRPFEQRQHLILYQLFGLCQLRHAVNDATTRAPARQSVRY
jgi:transposase InsO family protein